MNAFFENLKETPLQVWVLLGLFVVALIALLVIRYRKAKTQATSVNTKLLALGGMCVALSFVLSYIKLFSMPQGGSITLASMVPLILFAFIAGPSAGLIAGLAYGFLQFFQDAFAAHWISIVLDYPLAFACLGLAGIISTKIKPLELRFTLGVLIAIAMRFVMHVISGAVFFGMYAPEGMNPWVYSGVYNSFLLVECLITIVIGLLLIKTPVYRTLRISLAAE